MLQFNREFELVKLLNAKQCQYVNKRTPYHDFDKTLPVFRKELKTKLNFSSESYTNNRGGLLNVDNDLINPILKTCYLKHTIFDNKKKFFAETTTSQNLSSGSNGVVDIYIDKKSKFPISLGKFAIDYYVSSDDFKYNDLYFNISENHILIHEALVGLELVNRARYFLPNYPFTYGLGYCDMKNKKNGKKSCIYDKNPDQFDAPVVFIEYIDDSETLTNYLLSKDFQIDVLGDIFLQIFNALNILYMINGFYTHYDLHTSNILIQKLDKDKVIPIYLFDNENNLIDIKYLKTNYVAYIIDFGYNTYLSYESLANEVYKNNSKYFGKDTNTIKKDFIFGTEIDRKLYNSKIQDHSYDIYKLLGYSFYYLSKNDLIEKQKIYVSNIFISLLLTYLFDMETTENNVENVYKDFSLNSKIYAENFFSKPENLKVTKEYKDFVNFTIEIANNNIFTQDQLKTNELLKKALYDTCLNDECLKNPKYTTNIIKLIFDKSMDIKNSNIDEIEYVREIFISRRKDINDMLLKLANNKIIQSIPEKKEKEIFVKILDEGGKIISSKRLNYLNDFTGKSFFDYVLKNKNLPKYFRFEIYAYDNKGKSREIYNNNEILNLGDLNEVNIFLLNDQKIETIIFDYHEDIYTNFRLRIPNINFKHKELYEFIKNDEKTIEYIGEECTVKIFYKNYNDYIEYEIDPKSYEFVDLDLDKIDEIIIYQEDHIIEIEVIDEEGDFVKLIQESFYYNSINSDDLIGMIEYAINDNKNNDNKNNDNKNYKNCVIYYFKSNDSDETENILEKDKIIDMVNIKKFLVKYIP